MTIHISYSLQCTGCGRFFAEECDNKRELRKAARYTGWKRTKVKNGSMWDFCPKCLKEK